MTNTQKAYSTKGNALRAAREYYNSLRVTEPVEGKHFDLVEMGTDPTKWGWLSLTTTQPQGAMPRGSEMMGKRAAYAVENDAWLKEQYGVITCPACGVHLSNGVGAHNQDVNGKPLKHDHREFACLGCGFEFGPVIVKKAKVEKKAPANKQDEPESDDELLRKSLIESPTKAVWWVADELFKKNPNVRRKDIIDECVRRGIAYYTARTQYQAWYSIARKPLEGGSKG